MDFFLIELESLCIALAGSELTQKNVDHAVLEVTKIYLPLSLEFWD